MHEELKMTRLFLLEDNVFRRGQQPRQAGVREKPGVWGEAGSPGGGQGLCQDGAASPRHWPSRACSGHFSAWWSQWLWRWPLVARPG